MGPYTNCSALRFAFLQLIFTSDLEIFIHTHLVDTVVYSSVISYRTWSVRSRIN